MTPSNRLVILFCSLLLIFFACNNPSQEEVQPIDFKVVNLTIAVNDLLTIQDCVKWYADFNRIKRSVIYRDKIICVGIAGGFVCLNAADLRPDTTLAHKMNTDFYTNISVYQDTLFTEKFDQLYFWNTDSWVEYRHPKPIKYFDLLYEDDQYAFYSSCHGEFGSILFAFDKTTNATRAEFTTCPNSVIRTDSGYFVGTHLYHMAGHSYSYIIHDVEKMNIIDDSLRFFGEMPDRDGSVISLMDSISRFKKSFTGIQFYYRDRIMIIGSFRKGNKLFHIIDPQNYRDTTEMRLIGTIEKDTLRIVDSLTDCSVETITQFENAAIINQAYYNRGFDRIRNDTIFKISFATNHPGYQGPAFEGYNLATDSSKKISAHIDKLKLRCQFQTRRTLFSYDNRLFLFFGDPRNEDFKYGLIEITNFDKFIALYKG